MIFLELDAGLCELTGATFRMVDADAPGQPLRQVRIFPGKEAFYGIAIFTGTEPACRAVLDRIMNLIDAAPLTGVRVIRRKQYMSDDSNNEGDPK